MSVVGTLYKVSQACSLTDCQLGTLHRPSCIAASCRNDSCITSSSCLIYNKQRNISLQHRSDITDTWTMTAGSAPAVKTHGWFLVGFFVSFIQCFDDVVVICCNMMLWQEGHPTPKTCVAFPVVLFWNGWRWKTEGSRLTEFFFWKIAFQIEKLVPAVDCSLFVL